MMILLVLALSWSAGATSAPSSASCSSRAPLQLQLAPDYDSGERPLTPNGPEVDYVLATYEIDLQRENGGDYEAGDSVLVFANHFVMEVTKVDDLNQLVRMPVYSEKSWLVGLLQLKCTVI